jgi:hypothetical protein
MGNFPPPERRWAMRNLIVITLILLLGGCVTVMDTRPTQTYRLGEVKTCVIGDPFLVDQKGTVSRVKRWVGILYSRDGWQTTDEYSPDYLRRELLYAGKSGSIIEVTYREFRGGYAAQPFFQGLKYDLSQSKQIRFQNFTLEVLDADNQRITYRLLSDR